MCSVIARQVGGSSSPCLKTAARLSEIVLLSHGWPLLVTEVEASSGVARRHASTIGLCVSPRRGQYDVTVLHRPVIALQHDRPRLLFITVERPARDPGNGGATNHLISVRSEEHTSELQSHSDLVCRLLLEKKKFALRIAFRTRKASLRDSGT